MRSQSVTASKRNVRLQPLAFTGRGVVMLSSVLDSERAMQMSILVVNAFELERDRTSPSGRRQKKARQERRRVVLTRLRGGG